MPIQNQITSFLEKNRVDFIRFVDITSFSKSQTQGFSTAILFGKALTPSYLKKVASEPHYVAKMILNKTIELDEFHNTEIATDALADNLAAYIQQQGYQAYSQSEKNIEQSGRFNQQENRTPLPHKSIALLAGLGWIGKNNLLITPEYGCAISMCSVLTDAPVKGIKQEIPLPRCNDCTVCRNICTPHAIVGQQWQIDTNRDVIIDVKQCNTCFMCVVNCPYTVNYINNSLL
ncbi:hypothetical protein [Carboxylicivirga sp. RSCT41]|uniref:hypothetical protein n=1 Tax=Carboxylicivirga agarovorans TaxID=3417570 RepID=UPI003D338F4B